MEDLREQIASGQWHVNGELSDEQVKAFDSTDRPGFFKLLFTKSEPSGIVVSHSKFSDIRYYYDNAFKCWFRVSHQDDTKKLLRHMFTGKM